MDDKMYNNSAEMKAHFRKLAGLDNEDRFLVYDILCRCVYEYYRDCMKECKCSVFAEGNHLRVRLDNSGTEKVFRDMRQAITYIEGILDGSHNTVLQGGN